MTLKEHAIRVIGGQVFADGHLVANLCDDDTPSHVSEAFKLTLNEAGRAYVAHRDDIRGLNKGLAKRGRP